MDLTVVTEGVEDWDSAGIVRDMGCDLAQGYVFARPAPLISAQALAVTSKIDISSLTAHGGAVHEGHPTAVVGTTSAT